MKPCSLVRSDSGWQVLGGFAKGRGSRSQFDLNARVVRHALRGLRDVPPWVVLLILWEVAWRAGFWRRYDDLHSGCSRLRSAMRIHDESSGKSYFSKRRRRFEGERRPHALTFSCYHRFKFLDRDRRVASVGCSEPTGVAEPEEVLSSSVALYRTSCAKAHR